MSDELRCDCHPDARPVVREANREADRVYACLRIWYVQCQDCKAMGELSENKSWAMWAWNNRERTVE